MASEARAREVRYEFLGRVMAEQSAVAIITAHHRDDVLETAIINMLRGTGRKGLTALQERRDILRPLLEVTKKELLAYAQQHNLAWREDSTNNDERYLRNYVRQQLLPKFTPTARSELITLVTNLKRTNQELDTLLVKYLDTELDRRWFNQLPHAVAREILAAWLRQHKIGFERSTLERLVVAAKTAQAGKVFPVANGYFMAVNEAFLALKPPER